MNLKSIIYISVLLLVFSLNAQDMQKGFTYLETGNYQKDHPDNKTARLCYGRAVGLNGNPEKAKSIFTNLLQDHPNDFEVKLNYGESLLWNKYFNEAKSYFKKLIDEDSNSFPALLSLCEHRI